MIDCSKIPLKDKGCHVVAGFAVAILLSFVFNPLVGLSAGIVAGAAKEALDQYSYRGADFFDFFATLAGTTIGVFTHGILKAVL